MPSLSLHSPLGDLTIHQDADAIVALDWGWASQQDETPLLTEACRQLHAYFDGTLTHFTLKLAPAGTPYRQKVWNALLAIPCGQTRTYQQIASLAGGSARSVGGANAANPIPILIPCHRVCATTHLGGYSGGEGLSTKLYLLELERALSPTGKPLP